MSTSRGARAAFGILASLVLVAGGACTAFLLAAPTVPSGLADPSKIAEVPVAFQDYTDPHPIELAFTRGLDVSLSAPTSGQVTAFACRPGGTFESGSSSISVDGTPIVSIATAVPLWRDLSPGDSGDDVRALQTELQRLGFPVTPDGVLGDGSIEAVESLTERAGGHPGELSVVPLAQLLWIPTSTVTTATCGLSLGGRVTAGDAVAVVAGTVSGVRVVALPENAIDGERMLALDEDTILPVSANGTIEGTDNLAAFAATFAARTALATEGTNSVSAKYVLASPVRIATVPPSALFAMEGEKGCLIADSTPTEVRVVGSQLGQSSVVFPDGQTPQSVRLEPESSQSCP